MQEFESIPEVLSQLLRTVFVAPENKHLLVADYHSIEACVLSWLAGEGVATKSCEKARISMYTPPLSCLESRQRT